MFFGKCKLLLKKSAKKYQSLKSEAKGIVMN